MIDREALLAREETWLSPFAARGRAGVRRYPEREDELRTPFQRDRDRIIHCTAFRRLQHKTQVFASYEGDYYRTRLTHSLEVSQMARSVALALRLNVDLTEAVALAHDLGHPPFGHAGEEALHELMRAHGGFRHNVQGLRIVDHLEHRYAHELGLNLTDVARRCLLKGEVPVGFPLARDLLAPAPTPLEGRIADLCDRAAYLSHDLDDAFFAGLVTEPEVAELELWKRAREEVARRSELGGGNAAPARVVVLLTVSELIALTVKDLVKTCDVKLAAGDTALSHSDPFKQQLAELHRFLRDRFYKNERVLERMTAGRAMIERLFQRYLDDPSGLPEHSRARIEAEGVQRVVCDYVAGMTDRFARKLAEGRA